MKPNKIKWYLGSCTLAMTMDQERKHWLKKTDKSKQVQDKVTGDIFQGRIDNLGSDIIIETEKLPMIDQLVNKAKFNDDALTNALELGTSVFPFIPEMNGLEMIRVKSINTDSTADTPHLNYRMRIRDCFIMAVPISTDEGDLFTYRWLCTLVPPVLEIYNPNTQTYENSVSIGFRTSDDDPTAMNVTNPVYFYPLDEVLQPFHITPDDDPTASEFVTDLINDPEMIGLPLIWFNCDQTNRGAKCIITPNETSSYGKVLTMGYDNNGSKYEQYVYPCVGPLYLNAPVSIDQGVESNDDYYIACSADGAAFTGTEADFNIPITNIKVIYAPSDDQATALLTVDNTQHGVNILKMVQNDAWVYNQSLEQYRISLSAFNSNALVEGVEEQDPLIPVFRAQLDQSIPFTDTTTDVGYAGMRFGSSKNYMDQFPRYPHDIEKMKGLPDWVRETTDTSSPQHLSVYAIHNTPSYNPEVQESRQIAGLIFDPGMERTYPTTIKIGRYRIKRVDIVEKGSGYVAEDIVGGKNSRVRIRFNNGFLSTVMLAIKRVDENGGVLEVDPLYRDEGDPVAIWLYFQTYPTDGGEISIMSNATYADYSSELVPDNVRAQRWYVDHITYEERDGVLQGDKVYIGKNEDKTETLNRVISFDDISSALIENPFEPSWDPTEFMGESLSTAWVTSKYPEQLLLDARENDSAGPGKDTDPMADHGGYNDDQEPWSFYTEAKGVGLKVRIEFDYIEEVTPPRSAADIPTEEIGRVYVLSNDDLEYRNNAKLKQPKPARTIARICDIPTSVVQLSNIHGIAPVSVVDKKYVRTEAPFTENDLYRLYNGVRDRWVRPIHRDNTGTPIYTEPGLTPKYVQSNRFIFDSVENLNAVDMRVYNDFRTYENLNAMVDPENVIIPSDGIVSGGEHYEVGSSGQIIVGGCAFEYHVISVNDNGGVTDVGLAPPDQLISIANFDMDPAQNGYTKTYGTSPNDTTVGTGLKVKLFINDYQALLPRRGKIIEGLYAFVKEKTGIWFYEYDVIHNLGWQPLQQISEINESDVTSESGLSVRDAFVNALIPSVRELQVQQYAAERPETKLKVLQTGSCINIIDTTATPAMLPTNNLGGRTVVDINKLYCREFGTLIAETKSQQGVINALKAAGKDYFDVTIFWKWDNEHVASNKSFKYGIIRRSFNNLFTTDTLSYLPDNDLVNKKFVHTNSGTMIMWNAPLIGPMVWAFNPLATAHETYYLDEETRELQVVRTPFKWNDIEILDANNHRVTDMTPLYNESTGSLNWNILTNSPVYARAGEDQNPIYQQPDFMYFYNDSSMTIPSVDKGPIGAWELVFPQVHSFSFRNTSTNSTMKPVRMQVIRGTNIPVEQGSILNELGDNVSYRTLVVEQPVDGRSKLKVFNPNTNTWDEI